MPTAEQIKQFLVGVVIPPLAGAFATWLVGTEVLAIFHTGTASVTAAVTSILVFAVTAGIGYLVTHHILSGHYTPAAKRAAGIR